MRSMPGDRTPKYHVGYGKPPRESRFKKGASGNPRGRQKGTQNLVTLLSKTIGERVAITENGNRRSITKFEASLKQLVNKAASGDLKSIQQLLSLVQIMEGHAEAQEPSTAAFNDADRKVLKHIFERIGFVTGEKRDE